MKSITKPMQPTRSTSGSRLTGKKPPKSRGPRKQQKKASRNVK